MEKVSDNAVSLTNLVPLPQPPRGTTLAKLYKDKVFLSKTQLIASQK